MSVIQPKHDLHSHFLPPAMASGVGPWCCNVNDLSTDDDEYITPGWVASMSPGHNDHAARLLNARRLYLNSLPELRKNWEQLNPDVNNYHSDRMEI
jgi:hypothetical protein